MLPAQTSTVDAEVTSNQKAENASVEASGDGRTRRTREEVAALVKEFHESGLTRLEFSRSRGIPLSTVHSWMRSKKKKRTNSKRPAGSPAKSFVPVKVTPPTSGGESTPTLRLELSRGGTLVIPPKFPTEELARILLAIESC